MGAALEIPLYLSELQILNIVKDVRKALQGYDQPSDVEDYDNLMFGVRVSVTFNIGFDKIEIKEAEILDQEYWDVIELDSIVFKHNLKDVIAEFNEKLQ